MVSRTKQFDRLLIAVPNGAPNNPDIKGAISLHEAIPHAQDARKSVCPSRTTLETGYIFVFLSQSEFLRFMKER